MRIRNQPDGELALMRRLRPLGRGDEPYVVLREVAAPGGVTEDDIWELKRQHHNLARTLALLTREKLIERSGVGYHATLAGRRLVAQLRAAAGTEPLSPVGRCRLVLVEDNAGVDVPAIEKLLSKHGEVVRSEGAYVRVAVIPDDFDLVDSLVARVRALGANALATRLVP